MLSYFAHFWRSMKIPRKNNGAHNDAQNLIHQSDALRGISGGCNSAPSEESWKHIALRQQKSVEGATNTLKGATRILYAATELLEILSGDSLNGNGKDITVGSNTAVKIRINLPSMMRVTGAGLVSALSGRNTRQVIKANELLPAEIVQWVLVIHGEGLVVLIKQQEQTQGGVK